MTSRHACVEAVWLYNELFRRYDPADPDAGLEQAHDAGRRWLRARLDAEDWPLPPDTADRIRRLFALADGATADDVDEWLEHFPRAFMGLIERRRAGVAIERPGRRAADRLGMPGPETVPGLTRPDGVGELVAAAKRSP